jgi:glycerol-3-phosphate dehydrogenase (NAD(P)+)
MRAAVVGAGAWGTALGTVLATNGWSVTIWSFEADVAASITERHENQKYLPGIALSPQIRGSTDFAEALHGAELVVAANPSHVTRAVMEGAVTHLPRATPVVSATKGI